jgi:hypothetical protein
MEAITATTGITITAPPTDDRMPEIMPERLPCLVQRLNVVCIAFPTMSIPLVITIVTMALSLISRVKMQYSGF